MHKLAEICVRRPVFATMLILALTVVGVFSFFSLGVDLLPKADLPTVSVTVTNPGASPDQIESEITKRIEGTVNTISGIEDLRSTSSEGVSLVNITFVLEKSVDVAVQEVRDKVNLVVPDFPETAKAPVIQKLDRDAAPILRIVVSAPRPLREVTAMAEDVIQEQIESITGVGKVDLVGGSRREIQVRIDPAKLRAYSLSIAEVAAALRQQNLELPGGRVEAGARELTVRTMGRIQNVEDFNQIAIVARGAYVVKVKDIGQAVDAEEDLRSSARLNGQPAVTLVVSKQSGQNLVSVANAVKQRLSTIAQTLPKDYRTEIIADQSIFINAAVDSIKTHLIEGSLLACVVIYIFLANIRTTVIAAIAIPTSIVSTFGLMAAMGYTLNQITMLALTLMVGIVIDDAIIVLENIYRFIEEKGLDPFEAAIEGTREIGLAVMATTLSLLAVFLPVGFMGGIVGRFMSSFGLTASFAIAVSLLVSFTLTPMLGARMLRRPDDRHNGGQDAGAAASGGGTKNSRFYRAIDRTYTRLLRWSMARRKVVVAVSAIVVVSIVPLFMFIGKNLTPEDDRSEFEISVRTAEGTSLPAMETVVERIARDIRTIPGVTDTLTSVGAGERGAVNSGSVYVELAPIAQRELSQQDLMVRSRDLLGAYATNLRTSVRPVSSGTGGGAAIQYTLIGPDIQKLHEYSTRLLARMKSMPDVVDPDTSLVYGKPELRIEVDRQRAADLGVRVADISQAVNTLIAGHVVSTFDAGDDQYDVRLRATRDFRDDPDALTRIVVFSKDGMVTLDNVVDIKEAASPGSIERLNRRRQVTLTANIRPGGSQAGVIGQLDQAVEQMRLPAGYTTQLGGASKELGRTGYYFVLAISLSFIFMYMVLAAQFESFLHPVTILLTLPIAIPFGILSLIVFGQTVNLFSGLGLLLLFGIVKKNAILQIDHTNTLRAAGLPRYDAIIQANRDRLRPILMTTLALVAGMIPLVVSSGPGSATNRSIGVLVVGGQSLCLLLTLLMVPVFYSLFEDLKEHPVWAKVAERSTALSHSVRHRLGAGVARLKALLPRATGRTSPQRAA